MKRSFTAVIIGLLFSIGANTTRAATVTWTGSGDMIWTQPDDNSWSATYQSGDDVVFAGAATGTVIQSGTLTPANITFTAGTYIFTNLAGSVLTATGNLLVNGPATAQFGNMANIPSSPVWTWGTTTIQGGGTLRLTRPRTIGRADALVTLDNGTLTVGADNTATYPVTNRIEVASGGGRIVQQFTGNTTIFNFITNMTGSGSLLLQPLGNAGNFGNAAGLRFSGDNSGYTGLVSIVSTLTIPTNAPTRPGGAVWFENSQALFASTPSVTVRDGGILGVLFGVTDAQLANVVAGPRGGLAVSGTGALTSLADPLLYVGKGGSLVIDCYSGSATPDRYGDSTPMAMNNIRAEILGHNTANTPVVEAVGTLSFQGGNYLYFLRRQTNSGVVLLPSSITTPTAGNTLLIESPAFIGVSMTNATIATLGSAPSVVNGMITPAIQQYAGGNGLAHFVTVIGQGGTQFLAQATYTSTDINTAGETDIVNVGATAQTLTTSNSVYAVRLGQNLTIAENAMLTIGSGGLLMGGGVTITNLGTLNFGSAPAVIGAYHTGSDCNIFTPIAGSGGLTIMGVSRALHIRNTANSFTGGVTINGGIVRFASTAANGNPVRVNTFGRLMVTSVGTNTIGGLSGDGPVSGWLYTTSPGTGVLEIAVSSGTYTYDGSLTDGIPGLLLGVLKSGAGTQVFSTNCVGTFSAPLTISNGTLRIDGTLDTRAVPVIVNSGGTLSGNGTIGRPVTVSGTLAPGSPVGTLTITNAALTLESTANLNYELGTPGVVGGGTNDLVRVIGNLTIAGTVNVSALTGFGAGTYRLFEYTGTLINNGLSVNNPLPGGFIGTINTNTAGQVNLIVSGGGGMPPVASFIASRTSGVEPLQVNFTDTSTGGPTSWYWDFNNDGIVDSTLQNPTHTFTAGVWTVSLVASNANGASSPATTNITVITAKASWESRYGVSANASDADGDGMSNLNEFLAGFNPTNSAASLRIISITRSGNDLTITYRGANGDTSYEGGPSVRTNVLEYTAGAGSGSYTNNFVSTGQTNILSGGTGQGIVTSFIETNGATASPSRYYRVRVLTP